MVFEISNKALFVGSCIFFLYFSFLVLNTYLQLNYVWIGFLQELVTIPLLVMLFAWMFFAIKGLKENKFKLKSTPFISFLLQIVTIGMLGYASF